MSDSRPALVIPGSVSPEYSTAIQKANPGVFLVLAQGEIPAAEPSANRHVWLTVISIVRGLLSAGKVAGIFTGPLIPIAATVAGMGLDRAEQALLDAPEVEDWTPTKIAAARAAVKDPTT